MRTRMLLTVTLLVACQMISVAQVLTQTVRGRVLDKESQSPLAGASVVVEGTNPAIATQSDGNGNFRLTGVPVGRQALSVSFVGYNKISIPEVVVNSSKEVVLNVELKESVSEIQSVTVTARKNKGEAMNTMATVSARGFNVEETQRYAGGLDDPARLASSFAGVSSSGDVQSNAIMVRGNAPNGVAWYVEGVEVPVPSHFANTQVMGGGAITLFSNQLLNNSDFYTGAFPAEYGNATAGIFDVKLRPGNNEKREHTVSLGVMGIDVSSEGPFKKGSKASYLFNYRYATFSLVNSFLPQSGLPGYQDLCFKVNLPTARAGTFSLWGMGGIDTYRNISKKDSLDWEDNHSRLDIDSKMYPGMAGISHKIILSPKSYIQSNLAATSQASQDNTKWMGNDQVLRPMYESNFKEFKYIARTTLNHKFNARLSGRIGVIANLYQYDQFAKYAEENTTTPLEVVTDDRGTSSSYQAFAQVKYDLTSRLSINSGVHAHYLALNDKIAVDPRCGIRFQASERSGFSLAYGMHSQMQPLNIYLVQKTENGVKTTPNKNLDFSRAQHFVLGYDLLLNENMRFKIEPYYQLLDHIAIEPTGTFSLINVGEVHGFNKTLVSEGTGTNYGIDFTLERFLKNGFYYLTTASIFQSKYKAADNVERNTIYSNNFIVNLLAGKEWNVGRNGKNNTIGTSARLYVRGGDRKNAVNEAASEATRRVVYDETNPNSRQNPMLYRCDISCSYRINRPKVSHLLSLQLNNALSGPMVYNDVFNYSSGKVEEKVQGEPFPSCSWKVEF